MTMTCRFAPGGRERSGRRARDGQPFSGEAGRSAARPVRLWRSAMRCGE